MVFDGATALHIAANNGNLDVGTLEHSWLLISSIFLWRCIYDTFINFMQTMHFIHAAKYHITDVPGFTKTAWVRLWRRSKLRIWPEYSIRQLKPIEAASYSDYHWVRWRMLPTNLSKAAGGVSYYQFNIGNWLGEYYLDIVLWRATDLKLKYQGGYLTIFFVLCTGQGSLVFFWWCDGKYSGIYISLEIEFEHTIEKKCESQHTYMPYRQRLTLV